MLSESRQRMSLGKLPKGREMILGDAKFSMKGMNDSDEELLANMVYIFLLLVFSGIALSCISFAIREYYLSITNSAPSVTSARIKEDEWDLQETALRKRSVVNGGNSGVGKNHPVFEDDVVQIPQTRVVSLTIEEVNNLKSGRLKDHGDGIFNQYVKDINSGSTDDDSGNDIFGKLRIVQDEIVSPGFSDVLLNNSAANTDGKNQNQKIRYSFFDLLDIRKAIRNSGRGGNILPIIDINSLRQIELFIDQCSSVIFNKREKSSTKSIYLLKILSFSKKFGVYYIPQVAICIENLISTSGLIDVFEKCTVFFQFLIIDSINNYFLDQWNFQQLNKSTIHNQFLKWDLSNPYFANRFELFQVICNFIIGICGLRQLKSRSKMEIRLITLLRKTVFQVDCDEYIHLLPIIGQTIHTLESKKIILELYYAVNNLIDLHYQCCMGDTIMKNYELKAIIQHGLFIKHDTNLRNCAQEMGKSLYSRNRSTYNWMSEVHNGDVYVSAIAKPDISDSKLKSEKLQTLTHVRVRPVTPGAWKIHPPEIRNE